jgi:hypothetical protein
MPRCILKDIHVGSPRTEATHHLALRLTPGGTKTTLTSPSDFWELSFNNRQRPTRDPWKKNAPCAGSLMTIISGRSSCWL